MIDIASIITDKLLKSGGSANVGLLRGPNTFCINLTNGGVSVDNLHKSSFLEWKVFEKTIELLENQGGTAKKGNAMNYKLGDEKLSLNCIEGYIAKEVYDKKIGDSVFRRITPIVNILIWADVCKNGRGILLLK